MIQEKTYRVSLIQGDYFNKGAQSVTQFYQSLFEHFSILSWINQTNNIQIENQLDIKVDKNNFKIYVFKVEGKNKEQLLVEFEKNPEKGTIHFSFPDQYNQNNIENHLQELTTDMTVSFSQKKEVSKLNRREVNTNGNGKIEQRTTIFIDIVDKSHVLDRIGVTQLQNYIQLKKYKYKENQLEYFYKEPLSKRYKQIPHCHFNIALQGGGAKGISYVGVFKALKQLHPHVPITSIIGSSAGGILAMAISTEMKPQALSELCYKMDTIPNNRYFNNESQITPEIQSEFDKIIKGIKCILHNNGILESSIFDQIINSLNDLQTSEKILSALEYINPSVAQLFTLQLKEPIPKKRGWFEDQKYYTKRFNYYGLLMAGMIKGDSVQTIAARCIIDYFCKHFNPNYMKAHPHLKARKDKIIKTLSKWGITEQIEETDLEILLQSQEYMKKVKRLTLKEYYDISGVELTSTSVDLDDQILRFFNHKTTPDLPVCKSIQMTGSFPVAFEAQTWKKQYGKYYIHYSNTRKEIDLTGHVFTDGGLLANFPIKYLDNEEMRPMYFSHRKNPKTTILYGFGLDQIQDKNVDEEHEEQKKKAIQELKNHIISSISKIDLLKNLIMSDSTVNLDRTKLEEIPLLNYLIKLLNTLSVSDYNLNIECFQESIVLTEIEPRAIESQKNVKKELEKFKIFQESIQTMKQISEAKKESTFSEVVGQACVKIRDSLNQYQTPTNSTLERLRFNILSSLYNYQGTRIKYNYPQSPEIREFVKQIQDLYENETFRMQDKTSSKDEMLSLLNRIQTYCSSLSGLAKKEADTIYGKIIDNQLFIINKTLSKIHEIMDQLQRHTSDMMPNQLYNKVTTLDYHTVYNFAGIETKFFIVDQPFITKIFQQISNLDLPGLKIENQIISQQSHIESQLQTILTSSQRNKIHLVLESKENSHLYFCGLFEILQKILHRQDHNSKKIDMITTSDMHSVFAFLLAGGKKVVNIRKEMWKVKDLVIFQKGIEEEYQTYNWSKTESRQMQELLELTWTDHYKIFQEMQQYLLKENQNDLAEQIKLVRNQFMYSKNQVTNTMQNILNHVTKSSLEALKIKGDPKLQKKRLAQFLSLKNGAQGKDYTAKNQMISRNTQRFIKMMMQHFEQLLINIILDNYVIKDTFELVQDEVTTEKVWKGALIKRLLSSKKLEIYIKNQLEEMNLNHNTTLSQFYQFCPRKITLNFALINKKKQRMELINRFTSPNMPIWAAIIASTSMPIILPEFTFLEEWEFSPFTDSRMRKLYHYFFSSPQDCLKQTYFSGNFVTTLPLELLTNQKMAQQNYIDPQQKEQVYTQVNKLCQAGTSSTFSNTFQTESSSHLFITFAFVKREVVTTKKTLQVNQRQKKFFTFSNVLNLGIDYVLGRFKNLEVGFQGILKRLELLKFLSVRIECHDNTIMKLYYDQTIKLPIGLGTLDFYKIEGGRAETLHQCIYQSQFVVRGIFQNLQINSDKESFYYSAKKTTYLQYQVFQDKIYLKFISKSKWNKKLATMYKIHWKLNEKDAYVPYDEEQIALPLSHSEIYLKFDFPDTIKLIRKSHQLMLDFSRLKDVEEAVFFKFNYEQLDKRYLLPVKLFSQRLRTRVIPPSKAIITQNKIQESVARLYIQPSTIPIKVKPKSSSKERKQSICDKIHKVKLPELESREEEIKPNIKYLLIKTIVNFKNDGLYCKECVKPLNRAENEIKSENLDKRDKLTSCSKCKNSGVIIGYQCRNQKCLHPEKNRYCFPCLFVYLLFIEQGICRCTVANHELQFISMKNSRDIVLCHFCSSGAISYYRDQVCDINLCYKCSLILENKKISN